MKLLRETIRKLILEIKSLDDEDYAEQERRGITPDDDASTNAKEQRRVYGLQSEEEQSADRSIMQAYHKELHSTEEGKQLIKQCMSGQGVTIWHSIGYESVASRGGAKSRRGLVGRRFRGSSAGRPGSIAKWKDKFGQKKNKNQISTCATSSSIGETIPNDVWGADNGSVIVNGVGFILRGYPAFVSVYDQMTQTLGSLPRSLVTHQRQSGVSKRAGSFDGLIIEPNFGFAGEAVLDNWSVAGVYMNFGAMDSDGDLGRHGNSAKDFMRIFWDALHTNLPVYVYDGTQLIGMFEGANEEHLDEIYADLFSYARQAQRGETRSMEKIEDMEGDMAEWDKTMLVPKVYLDKHPQAGAPEQEKSKQGKGPPPPSEQHNNPWFLFKFQEEEIEAGRRQRDPQGDWPDPSNPDLPSMLSPEEFESVGDLYDSYFPGWRNWGP